MKKNTREEMAFLLAAKAIGVREVHIRGKRLEADRILEEHRRMKEQLTEMSYIVRALLKYTEATER